MRHRNLWIFLCLVVLLSSGLAGFMLVFRIAPEEARVRAETGLSSLLGCPVHVEGAQLSLLSGFSIIAKNVSACPQDGSEPALRAKQLQAWIDPFALLVKQLKLDALVLDEPVLILERSHQGQWNLPLLQHTDKDPDKRTSPAADLLSDIDVGARGFAKILLHEAWPDMNLEIHRGRLSFVDRAPFAVDEEPFTVSLDDFSTLYRHPTFWNPAELEGGGHFLGTDLHASRFQIIARQNPLEDVRLSVGLSDFDLRMIAPYITRRHPKVTPGGHVTGQVGLYRDSESPWSLTIDLASSDIETGISPNVAGLQELTTSRAAIHAMIQATRNQIRITESQLSLGDLLIHCESKVNRPLAPSSKAVFDLLLNDLTSEQIETLVQWSPPRFRESAESFLDRFESIALPEFKIHLEAPLNQFSPNAIREQGRFPGFFEAVAKVEDTVVPGKRGPLAIHGGEIHWDGNQLKIVNGNYSVNEKPGPILNVTINGMPILAASEPLSHPAMGDVTPLPGIWMPGKIAKSAKTVSKTEWELLLEMDALSHPALIWPAESLRLLIYRYPSRQHYSLKHGIWGDAVVEGSGDFIKGFPHHLNITINATPADSSAAAVPDDDPLWSVGRWTMRYPKSPKEPIQAIAGRYVVEGTEARLLNIQAPMGEHGLLTGTAAFELSDFEKLPLDVSFLLTNSKWVDVARVLHTPENTMVGKTEAIGELRGALHPGRSNLSDLQGEISLLNVDGELKQEMPVLLALARATGTLNPFESREVIRFDEIETEFKLDNGMMHVKSFELDGRDLRIVATGSVDLTKPNHESDMVFGVFLFRFIDDIVKLFPWIGRKLVGKDKGIFGLYFQLDGSWEDPRARLITLKTLARGPASVFVEAIPDALRSAVDVSTIKPTEEESQK